jgi:hypothetical protein
MAEIAINVVYTKLELFMKAIKGGVRELYCADSGQPVRAVIS